MKYYFDAIPMSAFTSKSGYIPKDFNPQPVDGSQWTWTPPSSFVIDTATKQQVVVEATQAILNDFSHGETTNQTLTESFTIGGRTFPAGTVLESEFGLDVNGSDGQTYHLVAIGTGTGSSSTILGYSFNGAWPPEGTTLTFVQAYDNTSMPITPFGGGTAPCFTLGTLIDTPKGTVIIESLKVGDLVMTRDHGPQPIRWIGSRTLGRADLQRDADLCPVRIKAGALGVNTRGIKIPAQDLVVSPQHRIFVRSHIVETLVGATDALVAAIDLVGIEGVEVMTNQADVTYIHILFDRHEVVTSNGAETESLFTGPVALQSLPQVALDEIFTLFPDLRDCAYTPTPARILLTGAPARKMVLQHIETAHALQAA